MKKASSILTMAHLATLVFLAFGSQAICAQQTTAPAVSKTPVAHVNLINATGLGGELLVDINDKPENRLLLALGGATEMDEYPTGSTVVKISHPACTGPQETKLTLKADERLNIVVHSIVTPGDNGARPTTTLALLTLKHLPSPGKTTLSLLNCDALARNHSVALNGVEQTLNPLQPVHLNELPEAESYALTTKGANVMAAYEPLTLDHAYLVVYTELENPQLKGLVVVDRKPGTSEEELELKKREIAKRVERERKAAEWVMKELDRKTQERTEARAQRQKQRADELKR